MISNMIYIWSFPTSYLRNSLRISNHSLRVETSTLILVLPSLPIEDCKCFLCWNSVEGKLHFLFDCGHYHELEEHKVMCLTVSLLIAPSRIYLTSFNKWNFSFIKYKDLHARYLLATQICNKGFQTFRL